MGTNSFLLWCLLSLIAKTNENVCFDFVQQLLTKGRIVDGNPFWESKTSGVVECVLMCIRRKKCKSFNFNRKDGMCQINSRLGIETTFEENSVYSNGSVWPSQIDPDCHHRPCAEDEICIPGSIANRPSPCSYTCFKINDRKCPPPEGTMSSQPRTVGSVFTHRCGHGTVGGDSATCLPSGKWNKTIDTTCTPIHGMSCVEDSDCKPVNGLCTKQVCSCKLGNVYDKTALVCVEACEDDWIRFKGKCYYISDLETNATGAREFCKEQDAQLVQVDSQEENDFLKTMMTEGHKYWIDLYQFDVNGEERWMTSNETPTFTDWGPDEPDDRSGFTFLGEFYPERCTAFGKGQPSWADYMCISVIPRPLCQRTIRQGKSQN